MQHESKLRQNDTLLLIIDIQEKLLPVMSEKEKVEKNSVILASAAAILGIPVIVSEQYPQGLGPTLPNIKEKLPKTAEYYSKTSFSCAQDEILLKAIRKNKSSQILICGIEMHICVAQTALDLAAGGYQIHIAADAVSSRNYDNKEIALSRLSRNGIIITNTESALFELLKFAQGDKFKGISKLIK